MLAALSIRDVILIERLDLVFGAGLNALTGETGAGKSILLDALGLALGNRGEAGLVRHGATQASVSAEFALAADHVVSTLLAEQDIAVEDRLILRRTIGADGRSRAFVNDQPCGLALVRQISSLLVETHGQFDTGALLDRETHRATLDGFGRLEKYTAATAQAWAVWQAARKALAEAGQAQQRSAEEETWLREAVARLDELDPQAGEETELEQKRQRLANRGRIAEALTAANNELSGPRGAETALNAARRYLDRAAEQAGPVLLPAQEALARAAAELEEAAAVIRAVAEGDDSDRSTLESIDDRLAALRAAARRHGIDLAGLAALRDDFKIRLSALDDGGSALARLAREETIAMAGYTKAAETLTTQRIVSAKRFDKAIAAELPPLKLDKARIVTHLEPLPDRDWGPGGQERVTLLVATNPGTEPGPLNRIASGGELSRFMLALKVVLAGVSATPVMVFDEVDSGIGGATADAVGERLQRLGRQVQVLVVTHSPQVAARADRHWRVEKKTAGKSVLTDIVELDEPARREEIARMLSGATVTDEARAAAARLLNVA